MIGSKVGLSQWKVRSAIGKALLALETNLNASGSCFLLKTVA